MPAYQRIAIVGVGLIGGSIGLAVRKRGLAGQIVGIGRRQASLDKALACRAIDEASTDVAKAAAGADWVVVATPIADIVANVERIALATDAVITDAGSTKSIVCRKLAGVHSERFIGSHPLAGDHRSGPEHARADLFDGRTAVVTPTSETPQHLVDQAISFWERIGARTLVMAPEEHDEALAATSHLPHLAAAALAAATPTGRLDLAATGWADTTRVAAGDPELWSQIFSHNRAAVLNALDRFDERLAELRKAVEAEDWAGVRTLLEQAKRNRDALGD